MKKTDINTPVFRMADDGFLSALIEETLKIHSPFVLVVTGHSMSPTLHHLKDKVELVSKDLRQIKKGEVVLFKRNNQKCILHRVVRVIDNDTFIVKGDAQAWCEKVRAENVIGVVSQVCVKGKWRSCDSLGYKLNFFLWSIVKPIFLFSLKIKIKMRGTYK